MTFHDGNVIVTGGWYNKPHVVELADPDLITKLLVAFTAHWNIGP